MIYKGFHTRYPIKGLSRVLRGEGNARNLIRDGCHEIRSSHRRMYLEVH